MLLTLLCIFILTHADSHGQDTISAKYFPLKVGNRWVYTLQTFPPPLSPYITYSITKDTMISNHKYFLYQRDNSFSQWIRYDSLSGNLLIHSTSGGCSIYNNDKIQDSLPSSIGNVISCQHLAIFTRMCTQISSELILNTVQKPTKMFEHDGLVLQYIKYAQDFGIIWTASGEPPPANNYEILKGCVINGIVYGDTTLTSVELNNSLIPENFLLSQNYPNPFNPSTVISYRLAVNSSVMLKVFNALGSEVATLINEKQSAGNYAVKFDGIDFPSGIYFYTLKTENFSETRRMVLLK